MTRTWFAAGFVCLAGCADPVLVRCEAELVRCEKVIEQACQADDRFCFGSPANSRWRLPLVVQCSDNYRDCLATAKDMCGEGGETNAQN